MLVLGLLAVAFGADVQHQGRLTDGTGVPINGAHDVALTLYDDGGSPIGSVQSFSDVAFDDGYYAVVISAPDADWAAAATIGVSIDGASQLTPAQPVFDVPNAAAVGGQTLDALDARYAIGVVVGASRPASPQAGAMFLDTGTGVLELFDGTSWRPLSEPTAPIGEVKAMLSNTAPDGFVWMDGQTVDKSANPELTALVDHLQSLGLGSGNTATVPNWNDGRTLVSAATLDSSNATLGTQGPTTPINVTASGSTATLMSQFDTSTTRNGGSFSGGSTPSLSWPDYRMPSHNHSMSHTHSDGSYVAAIGSAGNNINSIAFEANNSHISNTCSYTVIAGSAQSGCVNGFRNHNTDVKGTSGGSSISSTGSTGGNSSTYNTTRSGGSFSAGSVATLSWPSSYDVSYGLNFATGSTNVTGSAVPDPKRGSVRYAIRYR